jgi:hypothetical protein
MVYCVEKTARSVLFVWQVVAVELGIVMGTAFNEQSGVKK